VVEIVSLSQDLESTLSAPFFINLSAASWPTYSSTDWKAALKLIKKIHHKSYLSNNGKG
jgi:uncharacterized protein YfdQ (DUF2303 family)